MSLMKAEPKFGEIKTGLGEIEADNSLIRSRSSSNGSSSDLQVGLSEETSTYSQIAIFKDINGYEECVHASSSSFELRNMDGMLFFIADVNKREYCILRADFKIESFVTLFKYKISMLKLYKFYLMQRSLHICYRDGVVAVEARRESFGRER